MKRLYCALAALGLLAAVATPGLAIDVRGPNHHDAPFAGDPRVAYSCDEGFLDNGYFQDNLTAYSNAFAGVVAGPLTTIEYWHYAWFEVHGPYDYNVLVYDEDTCTEICAIGPLQAADAYDHDELESENLCDFGCNVDGNVVVGVQPLTVSPFGYYHPTVYFDQTGAFDGCDRLVDVASGVGCDTPFMNGDFTIRIAVDECDGGTPTETTSWSQIKSEYR
jgi:hypothetical protein